MLKILTHPCNFLKPLSVTKVFNTCKILWAVIFQVNLPPTRIRSKLSVKFTHIFESRGKFSILKGKYT